MVNSSLKETPLDQYLIQCASAIANLDRSAIYQIVDILTDMWSLGGKLLLCGNGGSAATCSHLAVDLTKCINVALPEKAVPFQAMALTNSGPLLTCIGNDIQFETVFAEQIRTWYRPNDVLLAISGSGSSPNILHAAMMARAMGMRNIIGLTGFRGGELRDLVNVHLNVPVDDMQVVEDAHMAAGHVIFRETLRRLKELSHFR